MEIVCRNGSLICIIINLQLYGLRYLRELYVSSNLEMFVWILPVTGVPVRGNPEFGL